MTEPETLYKLMILYLLRKVNFPMSNSQLWTFFDEKGYTNYFTFKDTLRELQESNLISSDEVRTIVRYEITKEGEQALYYFRNDITPAVLSDMDEYIRQNQFRLRNETGITSEYKRMENGEYVADLRIREGKNVLFEMRLSVPTEDQAGAICDHFADNAQTIYSYVMKQLI